MHYCSERGARAAIMQAFSMRDFNYKSNSILSESDKLKFNYLCSATYACIYLVYIGKELHIKNEPDVVIGF